MYKTRFYYFIIYFFWERRWRSLSSLHILLIQVKSPIWQLWGLNLRPPSWEGGVLRVSQVISTK